MAHKNKKSISLDELYEIHKQEEEKPQGEHPTLNNKYSKNGIDASKEENKYYLPVLNLNDASVWESKPKNERKHFTDKIAKETCLSNCCGVPGLKSACCYMDPDDLDHVVGPISEKWIKKIIKIFRKKGFKLTRKDVVIDFEEGQIIGNTFFNGHKVFDQKDTYPILRMQTAGPRFCCKFLNPETGLCNIYEHRPNICRNYYCQYVKTNFLVRHNSKPNTYQQLDKIERNKGNK